jgi:hypothetical protein
MPLKLFEIWLGEHHKIFVERHTDQGHYRGFSVVLLYFHGGEWDDIGRFDCAHGVPHQDVLGLKNGLLRKIWYDELSAKQVFQLALSTFKDDYEQITKIYLEN